MRHRFGPVGAVLAALIVAGLGVSGSAAAEPASEPGSEAWATSTDNVEHVTLVTGDRVTVTTLADGRESYSVAPIEGAERDVAFLRTEVDGDTYLMPTDVAHLAGTMLDRELFNVTGLIREGFTDEQVDVLPLIVQYSGSDRLQPMAAPLEATRALPAIGGAAVEVDKADAALLGRALSDVGADVAGAAQARIGSGALAGVERIWLDGRVEAADLDVNLTQIRAPEAWEGGLTGAGVTVAVLDTGVDATHPDLAGRVSDAVDFTGSPSGTDDVDGHGTHVAATAAGSGAGAPGVRSGVAHEADLIVGKVLGDDGRGSESDIIAGMQWAVDQGARVVNMSLGGGPTDGTDAVSTALDALSEASGTLFVVSAGNDGPGVSTVSAPSVADEALSVAAVDRSNVVAPFSSRGPRIGGGIKPEIAAPGVGIIAAQAGGNPLYTAKSGTSMAAPHVAGAAAVLAQAHPDWTGRQLKHALMGTVSPAAQPVDAVGAGVLDVWKAVTQTLLADTGSVDFGTVTGETAPVTRTVTVTNTGDTEVTADVDTELSTVVPGASPDGLLTVSPTVITLPAGGSAEISVTADPAVTVPGAYDGHLRVRPRGDESAFVHLPMVLDRSEFIDVTVLGADGGPAGGAQVFLLNLDAGGFTTAVTGAAGTARARVQDGRYAAVTAINTVYGGDRAMALLTADEDDETSSVVLDARAARDYSLGVAGESLRGDFLNGNLIRTTPDGSSRVSYGVIAGGAYGPFEPHAIRITPTDGLEPGTSGLSEHWRLADAASDHMVGDISVRYDLAFVRDEVAARPVVLSKAEKAHLARIDATWKAVGEGQRMQEGTTVYLDGGVGLNVTSPSFLQTPRERVEYVTGGDVEWLQNTHHVRERMEVNYRTIRQQFNPRSRQRQTWYGGPYSAGATAQVWEDAMQVRMADLVDSEGRLGGYADFRYPPMGSRSMTITRNGEPASVVNLGGVYEVSMPDLEPATYEIRRSFSAEDGFPIGGEGTATWRFTLAGGAPEPTAVDIPHVLFRADLDARNHAVAGRDLRVVASVQDAGRITAAEAAYTIDGGTTWEPLRLTGSRQYMLKIPAAAMESGRHVGLRFAATDVAGNAVDLSLPRAIPVE